MIFNKGQAGLSIVELLVALVISMLLMTGVVQVFLASKQTYASNEAASRLQENGRFALEFIAQSARHAGYVEAANITVDPLPRPIIPPSVGNNCDAGLCSTQGTADNQNASDSVSFSFQPRVLEGARRDCLGKTSGISATDIIINNFYIAYEGAGTASLACASRNVSQNADISIKPEQSHEANILVEGIDALQVQYGIATTGNVSRYVSADRLSEQDWNNVVAVRIAVLANSIDRVSPSPPAERQYVLLDAAPLSFTDGKARQVFTSTIKLRNTGEP